MIASKNKDEYVKELEAHNESLEVELNSMSSTWDEMTEYSKSHAELIKNQAGQVVRWMADWRSTKDKHNRSERVNWIISILFCYTSQAGHKLSDVKILSEEFVMYMKSCQATIDNRNGKRNAPSYEKVDGIEMARIVVKETKQEHLKRHVEHALRIYDNLVAEDEC